MAFRNQMENPVPAVGAPPNTPPVVNCKINRWYPSRSPAVKSNAPDDPPTLETTNELLARAFSSVVISVVIFAVALARFLLVVVKGHNLSVWPVTEQAHRHVIATHAQCRGNGVVTTDTGLPGQLGITHDLGIQCV